MKNKTLAQDYISRAQIRLLALETLFKEKGYADVVRESQEVVELSLKALLKSNNIAIPRLHDVSSIIEDNRSTLRALSDEQIHLVVNISRTLRRDRELAFYGSEDLTPSEFYKKEDAETAKSQANQVVEIVKSVIS